jgi:hypothetical protein
MQRSRPRNSFFAASHRPAILLFGLTGPVLVREATCNFRVKGLNPLTEQGVIHGIFKGTVSFPLLHAEGMVKPLPFTADGKAYLRREGLTQCPMPRWRNRG